MNCLARAVRFLYERTLFRIFMVMYGWIALESDDYTQQMRKKFITITLIYTIPSCIGTLLALPDFGNNSYTVPQQLALTLPSIVISITGIVLWVQTWRTRHASAQLVGGAMIGYWLETQIHDVFYAQAGVNTGYIIYMAIPLILKSSYKGLLWTLCSISFLLSLYNGSFALYGYPSPYYNMVPTLATTVTRNVAVSVIAAVLILAIANQSVDYFRILEEAKNAAVLSQEVCTKLSRYDTAGADGVLSRAGNVDLSLVSVLRCIVLNLEAYCPFLPHYVMRDGPNAMLQCASEGYAAEDIVLDPLIAPDMSDQPSLRITVALLNYGGVLHGTPNVSHSIASMNAFVDRVHEAAEMTQGSVHSFVGDCVCVTWNATYRTQQHELKGAAFLLAMRDDIGGGGARLAGGLCSGEAACYVAGTFQQAVCAHYGWERLLRDVYNVAVETSASTVSYSVHCAIRGRYATRCVDALSKAEYVYELLGPHEERDPRAAAEESMVSRFSTDAVSEATQLAVQGECGAALEVLDHLSTDIISQPSVRRLLTRVRYCAEHGSSWFGSGGSVSGSMSLSTAESANLLDVAQCAEGQGAKSVID